MTKITSHLQNAKEVHTHNEIDKLMKHELAVNEAINKSVEKIVSSDPINTFSLERATRIAVAITMDNCVDQLFIIKALINEPPREPCDVPLEYRSLPIRYLLGEEAKRRKREEKYERIPYTDCHKLENDICFVCTILRDSSKEIQEKGIYTNLLKILLNLNKEEEENDHLEYSYADILARLKYLKELLIKEKKEFDKDLHEARESLGHLKNEYEDILAYGKQEVRYVEKWEDARQHQHYLVLSGLEDEHNNCIETHKMKIDLENRVHGEIENFILENTDDLQNAILYWMHHYDEEIERRDSEIYQLKMKWEQLTEDHIKLQETFELHTQEIEAWLTYKEEKRLREEEELRQNKAAVKIQAWWRGTMVRKKLGPYRVKKGKKGKDKGKGKKGKKK